ncbi:MAG TPA: hypothetical protein VM942_05710 [Acidimicrobiales bacterium]|nr:hypothetical protein [Acidimicrobiales bacterium]
MAGNSLRPGYPHATNDPDAALRYQHATPERDRSIADAISRLIEAADTAQNPS